MDKYYVIGNPIAHSLSPEIHREFARQTGQSLTYERLLVPLDSFGSTVKQLHHEGVKGINITLPFKQPAFQYSSQLSERAQVAGSVNTFTYHNKGWSGDNTDGEGLIHDLIHNLKWSLEKKSILIIGAGGAARGILKPLLDQKPQQLTIANRSVEKARLLVEDFLNYGKITAHPGSFIDLDGQYFDLIINASSASLQNKSLGLPRSLIHPDLFCYDLAYSSTNTSFLQWAQSGGCRNFADGLGMLLAQAAEAFFIWRKIKPDPASILAQIRSKLCISKE